MSDNSPDTILVLSHETSIGTWTITTVPSTFDIERPMEDDEVCYQLSIGNWQESFDEVNLALSAVAEHKTGLAVWDHSSEQCSDYSPDWQLHLDKRFQMNLVADFLRLRPSDSLRNMVTYFERKLWYCLDGDLIKILLTELVTTGQLERLPSMDWAPTEFNELHRIAKIWLNSDGDCE